MLQPQPTHSKIMSGPSDSLSHNNVNSLGILQPQPTSQNQSQPPFSQSQLMSTLQPKPANSYIHTQPMSTKPMGMLQPQPVPCNQPMSRSPLLGSSRHPSSNVTQYKPPDMMLSKPSSIDFSASNLSSQSKPLNMQPATSFSKPPMSVGRISVPSSTSNSIPIGTLQLQPMQPALTPSTGYTAPMNGNSMPSVTGPVSRQVAPPDFRQDILQAQPMQPSLNAPQINNTTRRDVQPMPANHPQVAQFSGGGMRGVHSNAGILVPEKSSMISTSVSSNTPEASMTIGGSVQKPLIGAVPSQVSAPQQLSPGANPFADINDLLG